MKRIREIVWPWNPSSSLNFGFDETLTIKGPRQEAEIISIGVFGGELKVCLEEHMSDRIGKDRILKSFQPHRAGRFEIPDDATFIIAVPLAGNHAAMHIFELNRPSSLNTDPLYRPYSLSPHDPEPAPHSLLHHAWRVREALRIKHANETAAGAGCEPYSLLEPIRRTSMENLGKDGPSRVTVAR